MREHKATANDSGMESEKKEDNIIMKDGRKRKCRN